MYGWLHAPTSGPDLRVPPWQQAAAEAEADDDDWELSPYRDDATARRVRAMLDL